MTDMGMGAMGGMQGMAGMQPGDEKAMAMRDFAHAPDVAKGAGVQTIAPMPVDRTDDPGQGLENAGHRVLTYRDLVALDRNPDVRAPGRSIDIHLTGNMDRFMWSFDGVAMADAMTPFPFVLGERVRVRLVNDTMMAHRSTCMAISSSSSRAWRPRTAQAHRHGPAGRDGDLGPDRGCGRRLGVPLPSTLSYACGDDAPSSASAGVRTAIVLLVGLAVAAPAFAQSMPGMTMPMPAAPKPARPMKKASPPVRSAKPRPASPHPATAEKAKPAAAEPMPGMTMDMPGMTMGQGAPPMAMPTAGDAPPAGTALPAGDAPPPPAPTDHYADRRFDPAAMAVARARMMGEEGRRRVDAPDPVQPRRTAGP